MSQCSMMTLGLCGLMVGAIIVPPPPGPRILQESNRGGASSTGLTTNANEREEVARTIPNVRKFNVRHNETVKQNSHFPCFSIMLQIEPASSSLELTVES